MKTVNASLHHTGLTQEERDLVNQFNSLREAAALFPEGSALRGQLDSMIATVEIKLGL